MDEVGLTLRQASHTKWCQSFLEVEFAEEDKRKKVRVELRNTADSIVYQTRRTIDETKEKLSEEFQENEIIATNCILK